MEMWWWESGGELKWKAGDAVRMNIEDFGEGWGGESSEDQEAPNEWPEVRSCRTDQRSKTSGVVAGMLTPCKYSDGPKAGVNFVGESPCVMLTPYMSMESPPLAKLKPVP